MKKRLLLLIIFAIMLSGIFTDCAENSIAETAVTLGKDKSNYDNSIKQNENFQSI